MDLQQDDITTPYTKLYHYPPAYSLSQMIDTIPYTITSKAKLATFELYGKKCAIMSWTHTEGELNIEEFILIVYTDEAVLTKLSPQTVDDYISSTMLRYYVSVSNKIINENITEIVATYVLPTSTETSYLLKRGNVIFRHREGNLPAYIHQSENNTTECYYVDDEAHRTDGPAIVSTSYATMSKKGLYSRTREYYYVKGILDSVDGPAKIIKYFYEGNKVEVWEHFYTGGRKHKVDGPAFLHYIEENGERRYVCKQYYLEGGYSNTDDGSRVDYDEHGSVTMIRHFEKWKPVLHNVHGWALYKCDQEWEYYREYFYHDKQHRDDGPSLEGLTRDGCTITEYRYHGLLHRKDGPALIMKDKYGNVVTCKYYHLGVESIKECYTTL